MKIVSKVLSIFPKIKFIMTVDAAGKMYTGKNVLFICANHDLMHSRINQIGDQLVKMSNLSTPKVEVFHAGGVVRYNEARLFAMTAQEFLGDTLESIRGKFSGIEIDSVCVIHR